MPEYRIRKTGEIIRDLTAMFPNVSIPVTLSSADFDALGVDPVLEGPQPVHGPFQSVYRDGVEQIDGKWFTKYSISDWDQSAIDIAIENQWPLVRAERNKRLAECDWTQLPDAPLTNTKTAEWAEYRQALRDVTTQADPFNIVWPVKPS